MTSLVSWLLLILGAYLFGSFPSGYLAGRCCGIDIRRHGSGSTGATNVVRVINKKWGYTVFAIDCLKGFLPVLLATSWSRSVGIEPLSAPGAVAAVAALLGHNFPIWLKFQGGKGMATSTGIIFGLFPGAFFACLVVWVLLFYGTRYVSVASIGAAIALPASVILFYILERFSIAVPLWTQVDWLSVVVSIVMGVLALVRHRANIERLLAGRELKF
ncbi:MAG: glycerol-3-phosphate 1-O-acyltransferase PlsY [Chthoniobacterales bacterium]